MADSRSLEVVLQELLDAEQELIQRETETAGIDISVSALKTQMSNVNKNAKSTEEEKRAIQQQYKDEAEKLKIRLEADTQLEIKIIRLRQEKQRLLSKVKNEDEGYDVLNPKPAPQMQGSVIGQLPEFSGSYGADAEAFVKLIDRTKDQQNWQSRQTAQMVRSKLTGQARLFVDNQEKEFIPGLDEWDNDVPNGQNLRQMLLAKFALPVSAIAATNAIEHLKQEPNEYVDSFYERVRYSVDKLLYNLPKSSPVEIGNYRQIFTTQVFIFFKAGLLPLYSTKIFSAAVPPTNAHELLEAARNAEREVQGGRKAITPKQLCELQYGETMEVHENKSQEEEKSKISLEDLQVQLNAIQQQQQQFRGGQQRRPRGGRRFRGNPRGRGRGQALRRPGWRGRGIPFQRGRGQSARGRCFNCGSSDHWIQECPEPLRQMNWLEQSEEDGHQEDHLNY